MTLDNWLNDFEATQTENELPLTSHLWDSLDELPPAEELSPQEQELIGLLDGDFYSKLNRLSHPLFTHDSKEYGWDEACEALQNLADKGYPAAALMYAQLQTAQIEEDPARLSVADHYLAQAFESPYASSRMKEYITELQQANDETFDHLFPEKQQEGDEPTKEQRAKLAEAVISWTLAAKEGDTHAYQRLQTLTERGYHVAQAGCIVAETSSPQVGNKGDNLLQAIREGKKPLDLIVRGASLKDLPMDKQQEIRDQIGEEIRMRYDKRSYDSYSVEDIVVLRLLAENDFLPAQQFMAGYYEYAEDYVSAAEMSSLMKKNEHADPENSSQNLNRNYDEEIAKLKKEKDDNPDAQGLPPREVTPGEEQEKLTPVEEEKKEETPKTENIFAPSPATPNFAPEAFASVAAAHVMANTAAPQPAQPQVNRVAEEPVGSRRDALLDIIYPPAPKLITPVNANFANAKAPQIPSTSR